MRTILAVLLLLFAAGLSLAERCPDEAVDRPHFHIGVSARLFEKVKRNDAAAAFKAWGTSLARERGMKEMVDAFLFDEPTIMRSSLDSGELDGVCIPTDELMALGLKTDSVILPVRADGPTTSYALIVHRSSGIEEAAGLQGRRVIVHEGSGMSLGQGWLEAVLQEGAPKGKRRTADLVLTEKPMKGILEVFFRQADAALISTAAFEVACQMNPQLRQDLKVLKVSPPLIPVVFVFNHRFQGKSRKSVEEAILAFHQTPGGRQVLNMFQSSRMERHPISVLDETLRFISGRTDLQVLARTAQ
ncbi:MAG: PhnD/SsuA/transferrin family substrate-binding protein [Syntrophotaleaceae bacterium]